MNNKADLQSTTSPTALGHQVVTSVAESLEGFGGHLECNVCHRTQELGNIEANLSQGWPKCHGYTMTWITKNQEQVSDLVTKGYTQSEDSASLPKAPTGLDLDTIIGKLHNDGALRGLVNDGKAHQLYNHATGDKCEQEAKQALTRWGLEQRMDELEGVCKFPETRYSTYAWEMTNYARKRIKELQANLQTNKEEL